MEDIKALPFHRIIFLNLGGTCTVEAVEELWKQISLSDVLDELWVSEIPVLLKPFDLAIAPISTCLKRINLARVKVDHKYLKRSGKAISNNDKLETFTCSMLQTNPPCTESILPGLIFGSNRNLSIHLYDLFRVIDYFLLARHHLSLCSPRHNSGQKQTNSRKYFHYDSPTLIAATESEIKSIKAASKLMFTGGEKSANVAGYFCQPLTTKAGATDIETIFTKMKEYNM